MVEKSVAPLAGSVDRNIDTEGGTKRLDVSLPSRGAWIEIILHCEVMSTPVVAPLAGSVDRNFDPVLATVESEGRSPRGERG